MIKQGFIILNTYSPDAGFLASVSSNTLGMFMIGFLAIAFIPFLIFDYTDSRQKFLLWTAEIGLWSALAFYTFRNPGGLASSLESTVENLVFGAGNWGLFIVLLAALGLVVLAFYRFNGQIFIRYAITVFIPFSFLLAYLVDGSYRTGVTDTFNRMIMHMLLVGVLFIIIAVGNHIANKKPALKTQN